MEMIPPRPLSPQTTGSPAPTPRGDLEFGHLHEDWTSEPLLWSGGKKKGAEKEKSSGNLLAETVAVTRQSAFFF